MKQHKYISVALLIALPFIATLAAAAKSNWKTGRIYYQMVCSECHGQQQRGKISPNEKTKAEWNDYFEKNIHSTKDSQTVRYFVSGEYRESIKDTNRAAAKMLTVPEQQLLEDVKAFLIHTAKDSDQPSRCE